MINRQKIEEALEGFQGGMPFDHCVIDGFFEPEWAACLEAEFPLYDDKNWYIYENAIEHKRALNDWNKYPEATYKTLTYLISNAFVQDILVKKLGTLLEQDPALHRGGWHIHGSGGNLNPHLNCHLHPKLKKVRKLNLIVYLSSNLNPQQHGGHLGLWEHDEKTNGPGRLIKEVEPLFNRAILFDTTQNSWHGMSQKLNVPENVYRKSLALYYLMYPTEKDMGERQRARFAPRDEQKQDAGVAELIRLRADATQYKNVYKSK